MIPYTRDIDKHRRRTRSRHLNIAKMRLSVREAVERGIRPSDRDVDNWRKCNRVGDTT